MAGRKIRRGLLLPKGSSAPNDLEANIKELAYHEAGHVVIAAAPELRLPSEGLIIDTVAEGLRCYCKETKPLLAKDWEPLKATQTAQREVPFGRRSGPGTGAVWIRPSLGRNAEAHMG